MPFDFTVGIFVITVISVLAFLAGRRFQTDRVIAGTLCFLASLLSALLYAWGFSGRLGWAGFFAACAVKTGMLYLLERYREEPLYRPL